MVEHTNVTETLDRVKVNYFMSLARGYEVWKVDHRFNCQLWPYGTEQFSSLDIPLIPDYKFAEGQSCDDEALHYRPYVFL